jgi:hypothetical protein
MKFLNVSMRGNSLKNILLGMFRKTNLFPLSFVCPIDVENGKHRSDISNHILPSINNQ